MNCVDLPGNEALIALNRIYIRDANVALVVFSKTDKGSMAHAEKWIDELKTYGPTEMIICLCANKSDEVKKVVIDYTESQTFA